MKKKMALVLTVIMITTALFSINIFATTVSGPGGVARLNHMSSGGYLAWSVTPNETWPYVFEGAITYGGGAVGFFPVAGAGLGGGSASGLAPDWGKGSCTATLNGVAVSLDGDIYTVLPNCSVAYYKP